MMVNFSYLYDSVKLAKHNGTYLRTDLVINKLS
jgi:hypothetical protein